MGQRPIGKSLDRINFKKGYSPQNCRWATQDQQSNNTCRNIYYDYNGERLTLTQIALKENLEYSSLFRRVKYKNMNIYNAVIAVKNRVKNQGIILRVVDKVRSHHRMELCLSSTHIIFKLFRIVVIMGECHSIIKTGCES
jgi:hypothetical protein